MAKTQSPGNFGDFLEAQMNSFYSKSFPGLSKITGSLENSIKEYNNKGEDKEKKAESEETEAQEEGTPNKRRARATNSMIVGSLDDLTAQVKMTNIVMSSSYTEHVQTNKLLTKLVEGGSAALSSGGSGVGTGIGGGVLGTAATVAGGVVGAEAAIGSMTAIVAALPEILAIGAAIAGIGLVGYGAVKAGGYLANKFNPPEPGSPDAKINETSAQIAKLDKEIDLRKEHIKNIEKQESTANPNDNQKKKFEEDKKSDEAKIKELEEKKSNLEEQKTSEVDTAKGLSEEARKVAVVDSTAKVSGSPTGIAPTFSNVSSMAGGIDLHGQSASSFLGGSGGRSGGGGATGGFGSPIGPRGTTGFTNPIGDGHPGSEVGKMLNLRADNPEDRAKLDAYLKEGGVSGTTEGEAWCADWVNAQLAHEGIKGGTAAAGSFLNWGTNTNGTSAKLGDVLVAADGHHVGRYTGNKQMINGVMHYQMIAGNEDFKGNPYNTTPGRQGIHNGYGKVGEHWVTEGAYVFRAMPVKDETTKDGVSLSPNASQTSFAGDPNLPAGMRNNNPINIKHTERSSRVWAPYGYVGPSKNTDQGTPQVMFDSNEHGLEAAVAQIGMYGSEHHINTVRGFISKFTSPNATAAMENVAKDMGVSLDSKLDFTNPDVQRRMMRAVMNQEQGKLNAAKYTDQMINNAVDAIHGIKHAQPQPDPYSTVKPGSSGSIVSVTPDTDHTPPASINENGTAKPYDGPGKWNGSVSSSNDTSYPPKNNDHQSYAKNMKAYTEKVLVMKQKEWEEAEYKRREAKNIQDYLVSQHSQAGLEIPNNDSISLPQLTQHKNDLYERVVRTADANQREKLARGNDKHVAPIHHELAHRPAPPHTPTPKKECVASASADRLKELFTEDLNSRKWGN